MVVSSPPILNKFYSSSSRRVLLVVATFIVAIGTFLVGYRHQQHPKPPPTLQEGQQQQQQVGVVREYKLVEEEEDDAKKEGTVVVKEFTLVIHHHDVDATNTVSGESITRLGTYVNGSYPGPTVAVNLGDEVIVKVINEMPTTQTSIHFHGQHQVNTYFMDGVPHVTQVRTIVSLFVSQLVSQSTIDRSGFTTPCHCVF
jgi:FtsP/CotA-like multicopper oxidase with cupredoxin domain